MRVLDPRISQDVGLQVFVLGRQGKKLPQPSGLSSGLPGLGFGLFGAQVTECQHCPEHRLSEETSSGWGMEPRDSSSSKSTVLATNF